MTAAEARIIQKIAKMDNKSIVDLKEALGLPKTATIEQLVLRYLKTFDQKRTFVWS